MEVRRKSHQSVVQGCRQVGQIEPNVEGTGGRDVHIKLHIMQPLKNMVSFRLEVLLQGNLIHQDQSCVPTADSGVSLSQI